MNTQPNPAYPPQRRTVRPRPNQLFHTADALHFKATGGPLPMTQIRYFEACRNYTMIYTTDPKRPCIVMAYAMKQMCEWAPIMTRVRKGLAVSFAHVESIDDSDRTGGIVMKEGQQFVVSRRYWQAVESAWLNQTTIG